MLVNIKQLRQNEHDAREKVRSLNAAAGENNMTADQQTEFDAALANLDTAKAALASGEKRLEFEKSEPAAGAVVGKNNAEDKPWASAGEFLSAVRDAAINSYTADPRIKAALGENESVASEGGIMVPTEIAAGILKRTYDESVLADRCLEQPMTTARLQMMAVDEKSRVNGSRFGGIQAFWIGEADLYQPSKPKFRPLNLVANKLTALIYMTEELQADAPAMQSYNDTVVPEELAWKIDDAILHGTGAGMPLGFQNAPATIVVPKDPGQATGTVTTSNVLNMLTRLYARSVPNAAFFVNPAIMWGQLATLTIGSGTAVRLIYSPPDAGAEYGRLLGVPVIPIEQAAPVGSQGDIVLADLKSYILAKRQGLRADSSIHVAFVTGEIAFRWMMRLDGQPMWNAPLIPANGNVTTSPFVTLAARP